MLRRLVALLAATACVDQEPYSPSLNTLVVHAVLDATARDQYVIVQATTGQIRDQSVVTGASVEITAPDGRKLVAEQTHDSTVFRGTTSMPRVTTVYRISLDKYGIGLVAGGTYLLRIEMLDGRVVTGSTTIPAVTPNSDAVPTMTVDRHRDTVRLAWTRVTGAKAYEVFVSTPTRVSGIFTDTSVVLPGLMSGGNGPLFVTGTNTLVVNAVDANYYDYYRRTSDPFTSTGLITRLDGAVGVFGSIVPILRRNLIVQ